MKVQTLDESVVREIGHAFGCYDDGKEPGFVSAFSCRDAAAEQICVYVRMTLKAEMLYTTSERGEGYIAFLRPGDRFPRGPSFPCWGACSAPSPCGRWGGWSNTWAGAARVSMTG